MFKRLCEFWFKILYSNPQNKKIIEDTISFFQKEEERGSTLLIENIISFRSNLLTLAGGLIAFIGFFTQGGNISQVSSLCLKISILAFVVSIICIVIITIGIGMYDIGLIRFKLGLIQEGQIREGQHIKKLNNIDFGKSDADLRHSIAQDLLNKSKNGFSQKLFKIISNTIIVIFGASLILGLICLMIYYSTLMF